VAVRRVLLVAVAAAALVPGCSDSERSLGYQLADLDIKGDVAEEDERGYGDMLVHVADECGTSPEELADLLRPLGEGSGTFGVYDAMESIDSGGRPEQGCPAVLRRWAVTERTSLETACAELAEDLASLDDSTEGFTAEQRKTLREAYLYEAEELGCPPAA